MEFESCLFHWMGFPGVSDSKESTCNVQDQVQSLGSMDRGTWQATVHGVTESDITERLSCHWLHDPGRVA